MDVTEHAHQTFIKDPGQSSNNQGYNNQICQALDHADKGHQFDLDTSICEAGVKFGQRDENENGKESPDKEESDNEGVKLYAIDQTSSLLASIHPVSNLAGPSDPPKNYSKLAKNLLDRKYPYARHPYHTYSIPSTVFHLSCKPPLCNLSVDEEAVQFGLIDSCSTLADYLK